MISKVRACCNQDWLDPDGAQMTAMIAVWAEVLQEIPSEYLNHAYLEVVRSHASSFPLGANEIATAWRRFRRAWVGEQSRPAEQRRADVRCDACGDGNGWEMIPGKGARPCVECNPGRLATWEGEN